MKQFIDSFPPQLTILLENSELHENTIGESESHVFHAIADNGTENRYLKIHPADATESLMHEAAILRWLDGKIAVPRVLYSEKTAQFEFLLLSEIAGLPSFATELRKNTGKTLREIARSLRMLHAIPIDDCPFDERLEKKLAVIDRKIRNNEIDTTDLEPENENCSISTLYARVHDISQNVVEDLVFTHGDFCMPNILICETQFSGLIDMGRAGISDRYQDIALMLRSLKHNGFNHTHCELFLYEYGITQPDYTKIELYTLVDEFY